MDTIEVPELPRITHQSTFYRPGFLSMTIIGKSGCGKTRMLTSILPGISKSIRTVLIATAIHNVPYHLSIQSYFQTKNIFCGISHSPDEMREAVIRLEARRIVTLERQGLIIFDDFNTGSYCGPYWEFVIHAFTKLRNTGWNFIIISQNPTFIPPIVRNCTTARVLFDCNSRSALATFTADVSDRLVDASAYKSLLEYIRKVQYSYILIREHPFDICAGKLGNIKPVMNDSIVLVPTMNELMQEMSVSSERDLDSESARLQSEAGNTATEVINKC